VGLPTTDYSLKHLMPDEQSKTIKRHDLIRCGQQQQLDWVWSDECLMSP